MIFADVRRLAIICTSSLRVANSGKARMRKLKSSGIQKVQKKCFMLIKTLFYSLISMHY